jgi:hypothetical protein
MLPGITGGRVTGEDQPQGYESPRIRTAEEQITRKYSYSSAFLSRVFLRLLHNLSNDLQILRFATQHVVVRIYVVRLIYSPRTTPWW